MELILIYGPPAVGKLTVAKELEKLTGFAVLHNHLVGDLIFSIFKAFGASHTKDLNSKIKMDIYEHASKNGISGIISTFVYYNDKQANTALADWVELMKRLGGEIFFVKLSCSKDELEKRVVSPSRVGTKKIGEVEKLRKIMDEENLLATMPNEIAPSLIIDNTGMSPEETAKVIYKSISL